MSLAAHWEFISNARWFSGKARNGKLGDQLVLDWYSTEVKVRSELFRVDYPDGGYEWYHLPISYYRELNNNLGDPIWRTTDGYGYDATSDPAAMSAILQAIMASTSGKDFSCHSENPIFQSNDLTPRRYTGEQSNTSVFFGNSAMLKIFRKLEPGKNLDIELHQVLSDTGSVAQLYGWISTVEFDLMMLVESIPEPIDGYVLACQKLSNNESFSDLAGNLGQALAEVHLKLSNSLGSDVANGAQLGKQFISHAQKVSSESAELAKFFPQLVAYYSKLPEMNFATQRVHGDFHLGQTLHTPAGWRFVDFEGEPMKTMAERNSFDSPWRDVAGMLRSFHYAAATKREVDYRYWLSNVRQAFLKSYCLTSKAEPDQLLMAYELDKAVYEVRYEIRNRPAFVDIPLSFIAETFKEN